MSFSFCIIQSYLKRTYAYAKKSTTRDIQLNTYSLGDKMIKAVPFLFFLTTFSFAGGIPKLKISPTTDCELPNDQSIAYCPTAIFAWNKLEKLAGEPIKMENQDQLVDDLNNAEVPESVAPTNAHVAMAGFIEEGILDEIKKALRTKFGSRARLPDTFPSPDTTFVSFAYLERNLPFVKRFRKFNIPLSFTNGNKSYDVQSFGVPKHLADDYTSSLKIINYKDSENFSLKMKTRVKDEFILLSKIQTPKTLKREIDQITADLQREPKGHIILDVNGEKQYFMTSLFKNDLLVIPKVKLNKTTDFHKLLYKPLLNKELKRYNNEAKLGTARQNIKFLMDEKGAYVRSESYFSDYGGGSTEPRKFIFDKPFLITMWKKDQKQPYLAVWVASPDILYKFKKK